MIRGVKEAVHVGELDLIVVEDERREKDLADRERLLQLWRTNIAVGENAHVEAFVGDRFRRRLVEADVELLKAG